ncbi:MAG TPA: hypothetical protein ENF17_03210 [Candidatus Aminicenantes bacterium]|nr:hypothetical protein [Candidatus Aminicenantes bacterium]
MEIRKVSSRRDQKEFILFPWKVYQNDPYWVPPLIIDMKEKLNKKKHPFFEHADLELFLAVKDGEVQGRIAAILDERHNEFRHEKVVFFGLYESFNDPEVAQQLLSTVANWGKAKGMNILRGPMNLSMNDECAFLLEGFDSSPVIMMTYNPPYYNDLMTQCGLVKAKDLYAFYMTKDHQEKEKVRLIVEKARRDLSVTLRTVNMKDIVNEARKIAFIYNEAWKGNWGFVPWTEHEMIHMANKLKQFADPDLVIFAENKGQTVGFAFGLPNYNEILKKLNGRLTPWGILYFLLNRKKIKGMRAVVFGVLKKYRMTGLSYLLYNQLEKNALRKGYEWCETSWQLEDNQAINKFTESLGGRIYKKYRIYEKEI